MRIELTIKQSEVTKMTRQVLAWQRKKRAQIIALIEDTANAIQIDAQARVSTKSGILKSDIKVLLEDVHNDMVAYVVADRFYARMVELGTRSAAAHPFMHPAAETHIAGYIQKLARILSTA